MSGTDTNPAPANPGGAAGNPAADPGVAAAAAGVAAGHAAGAGLAAARGGNGDGAPAGDQPLGAPAAASDLLAQPAPAAQSNPEAQPPAPAAARYGDAPALPEGITVREPEVFAQRIGAFDARLGDLETKFGVSHEAAAAFRQEVLQMAFNEIAAITRRAADSATSAAAEARRQLDAERATQSQKWRQEFEDDPSLAGNHRDTTLWRANAVIDEYAADRTLPPAERKAQTESFKKALRESGLQNHPAMVRLLRNVGNDLVEGKPVPALKAPPPPRTKAERLYR